MKKKSAKKKKKGFVSSRGSFYKTWKNSTRNHSSGSEEAQMRASYVTQYTLLGYDSFGENWIIIEMNLYGKRWN